MVLRMERKSLLGALNACLKEERARTPAMKKMTRTATNAHLNAKKMTRTATKRKVAKVAEEARDAKVAREVKAVREVQVAREEKVAVVLTMERLLTKRTKVAYSKEARASQSNKEAANGQKESQKKGWGPFDTCTKEEGETKIGTRTCAFGIQNPDKACFKQKCNMDGTGEAAAIICDWGTFEKPWMKKVANTLCWSAEKFARCEEREEQADGVEFIQP